jgi:hypothetical protein
MLPIHSGREIPWEFGIKGITDDNLPGPVGSALLEMVGIGDPAIIVAGAAGSLWAVRNFAIEGKRIPIETLPLASFDLCSEYHDRKGLSRRSSKL